MDFLVADAAIAHIEAIEELEKRCRKCTRIYVSDTGALARTLDRLGLEYRIADDHSGEIYADVPVTELVELLARDGCTVRSIREQDESLESFYMNLVGGEQNA